MTEHEPWVATCQYDWPPHGVPATWASWYVDDAFLAGDEFLCVTYYCDEHGDRDNQPAGFHATDIADFDYAEISARLGCGIAHDDKPPPVAPMGEIRKDLFNPALAWLEDDSDAYSEDDFRREYGQAPPVHGPQSEPVRRQVPPSP